MPPVNVVVAGVPKVAAPVVPLKARAATGDVAELGDVATYKAFDIDRRVHWSEVREASVRASCAAVELAIVSVRFGVVVPMPTLPPKNWAAKLLPAPVLAFTVRPYELVVEAFSAEALNNRVWLLVEVAKFPRSGAPVTPRVARSVKSPAPMLLMASVGAFTRKEIGRTHILTPLTIP